MQLERIACSQGCKLWYLVMRLAARGPRLFDLLWLDFGVAVYNILKNNVNAYIVLR